jgi:hypothetical protein
MLCWGWTFLDPERNLRTELANIGKPSTDEAWYRAQLILSASSSSLPSAQKLGNAQKEKNVTALARLLAKSKSTQTEELK